MNSEERHRLHENELNKAVMTSYDFAGKHAQTLLLGVVAVVVAAGGFAWWSHVAQVSNAKAWTDFSLAETETAFADVANANPGTLPGAWAHLKQGELLLEKGLQDSFTDREVANGELKNALQAFEAVLKNPVAKNIPELKDRAQWNLAQTLEAQCAGDLDPVIAAYEKVSKDSVYRESAESRVQRLKKTGADFYAWFSKEKPVPAAPSKPKDGRGVKAPRLPDDEFPPLSNDSKDLPGAKKEGEGEKEAAPLPPKKEDKPSTEQTDAPKPGPEKSESPKAEAPKSEAPAKDDKKPE